MSLKEYWRGKRILITGGTSGLGRALAVTSHGLGARVAVVARGEGGLRELASLSGIVAIRADISRKEEIHRISGEALGRLGGLDVLINNASTLGPTPLRPLIDTECEDLEAVLETNLVGSFRLTKAILPALVLQGGGTVLNISSDAALSAYPKWGAYAASKAALDQLSRVWDAELSERGVRVLSIDPGDMDTPMHLAAIPDADRRTLLRPEDVARDVLRFIPEARSVAGARFAASEWRKHRCAS